MEICSGFGCVLLAAAPMALYALGAALLVGLVAGFWRRDVRFGLRVGAITLVAAFLGGMLLLWLT